MPKTEDMKDTDLTDTSFCFIGEPGTGKTKLLASLPKPLYVFDFDKGMRTLRGESGIEYDTYRDGPFGQDKNTGDEVYGWGKGWSAFMGKLIGFSKDCPYASVALDTVSFMQELCKNYVRKENPSTKQGPEAMELPQWGELANRMRSALDLFTMLNCVKVATCHVKRDINPLNNEVEFVPLIDGGFQGKIASFFDEVYYTNVKTSGLGVDKKQQYVVQTRQSGLYKSARTRIGVPDGLDVTGRGWSAIEDAIKGIVKPTAVVQKPAFARK